MNVIAVFANFALVLLCILFYSLKNETCPALEGSFESFSIPRLKPELVKAIESICQDLQADDCIQTVESLKSETFNYYELSTLAEKGHLLMIRSLFEESHKTFPGEVVFDAIKKANDNNHMDVVEYLTTKVYTD